MELSRMPFVLKRNRVAYLIKGGTLLKEFFRYVDPDNRYSQVWLASTVTSSLREGTEGLSVLREDYGGGYLKELLEREPVAFLGREHTEVYGASPAVLVKLLNSGTRLLVQTHPTKEKAKRYFGLPFGKTECWYVLAVEKNRPAYIYAGFRPGVTRECFCSYYRSAGYRENTELPPLFCCRAWRRSLYPGGYATCAGGWQPGGGDSGTG